MTFQYRGYGLRIDSDVRLPELTAASAERACDLHIRFDADRSPLADLTWVIRLEASAGEPWLLCAKLSTGYLVRFPAIADFVVRADGGEIACCSTTLDRDDGNLRHMVLDQVMPLALKLRGDEVLHATAIKTPRGACAFIGPSGCGKSTLAAAFLTAGYQVISDDCLRVDTRKSTNSVVPAYAGVRLCSDVIAALHLRDDMLVPVGSHYRKRRWLPPAGLEPFPVDPLPLTRIYRLVPFHQAPPRAGQPPLGALSVREAFVELVGSTFRFDALDRRTLTGEFETWERLARAVPMRRLRLDNDLRSAKARELVLADLSSE